MIFFLLALDFGGGIETSMAVENRGSWSVPFAYFYNEFRVWGWGGFAKFGFWSSGYARIMEGHYERFFRNSKVLAFYSQNRFWFQQPVLQVSQPDWGDAWAFRAYGVKLEGWSNRPVRGLSGFVIASRLTDGPFIGFLGFRLWPFGDVFAIETTAGGKSWGDGYNGFLHLYSRFKGFNAFLIEGQFASSATRDSLEENSYGGYLASAHFISWKPWFLKVYLQGYIVSPDFRSYLSNDLSYLWNGWWGANRKGYYGEITFRMPKKWMDFTLKHQRIFPFEDPKILFSDPAKAYDYRGTTFWNDYVWNYAEFFAMLKMGFGMKFFGEYGSKKTLSYPLWKEGYEKWASFGGWLWVENRLGKASIGYKRTLWDAGYRNSLAWELILPFSRVLKAYLRASLVEDHYGARMSPFVQIRYLLPDDRGEINLEYGEGWYSDSLLDDGDLISDTGYVPYPRFYLRVWISY